MKSVLNSDSGNNVILRSRQLNFSNKVATISDSRVTEDTLILVYYSEATQAAAQAAGITAETNAGNITFTAANTPSSAIVCDIVLLSANMINFSASANQIDYSNSTSSLAATTVQGAIDEVNSSLVGVNIGSRTGSSDFISISGLSFNELEVVVYQTPDNVVTMNIPRRALADTGARYFRAGGWGSSSQNAIIIIQVNYTSSMRLYQSVINSSDVTSTSIIEVYIK